MRVGWLADDPSAIGGAELTHTEFLVAAPSNVKVIDCPHDGIDDSCDLYVIHNCVQYTADEFSAMEGRPVIKYWHDVGPWLQDDVRAWLYTHARMVCCSPLQREHMGIDANLAPPPIDLDRFARAAESVNGNRSGAVCVASWRNAGKGQRKAIEWGQQNGGVDFFGGGYLAPPGSVEVAYGGMPALLAGYKTFVFLPTVIEPFGRLVAEAWAAGCEIVTNGLVGARWWIEENPKAIETAAEDFWKLVLA